MDWKCRFDIKINLENYLYSHINCDDCYIATNCY